MSISREAYRELAAVVGAENISDKQYILAGNRARTPEIPFEYHSPDAIIMPSSTYEVQQIVKICNKYDICFVAHVSGVLPDAYANRSGTLLVHLKRMNRIVEINEEDKYAVIEPGVRHVQLYPELRKRGFTYVTAAVGPGGSVLANYTSTSGDNHNQYGASRANRYLLGVEVVLPDGEVLRTGSLQTGSGWFCPDGPGPGQRGLIKGYFGSHGQLGIVTRAAVALLPCKGPKEFDVQGLSPNQCVYYRSDCSKVYAFSYSNLDDVRDAIIKLGEAEIASSVQKFFYLPLALMMTDSADSFWEIWDYIKHEMKIPLVVHLAPNSVREMAYEEKILEDVVKETGGKRVPADIEGWWEKHMDFFMVLGTLQRTLRLGGGWMPIKLGADSTEHIFEVGKSVSEFIYDFTETGKIFDAPDNYQIVPMEYAHFAHIELLFMWDRTNPEAGKGVAEFRQASRSTDISHHYHGETLGCLNANTELMGPLYDNYHIWLRKIKESFDPKNISNPLL